MAIPANDHPRMPAGGRSTDPADLPAEKTAYALRDLEHLRRATSPHPGVDALDGGHVSQNPTKRSLADTNACAARIGRSRPRAPRDAALALDVVNDAFRAMLRERSPQRDRVRRQRRPMTEGGTTAIGHLPANVIAKLTHHNAERLFRWPTS